MTDLLNDPSAMYIVGAVIVGLLLIKKLIKWAFIIGLVGFVIYLNSTGALDTIKSQLGL